MSYHNESENKYIEIESGEESQIHDEQQNGGVNQISQTNATPVVLREEEETSTGCSGDGEQNADEVVVNANSSENTTSAQNQVQEEQLPSRNEEDAETGGDVGDGEHNVDDFKVDEDADGCGSGVAQQNEQEEEQRPSVQEDLESTDGAGGGEQNAESYEVDEGVEGFDSEIAQQNEEQEQQPPSGQEDGDFIDGAGGGEQNAEGYQVSSSEIAQQNDEQEGQLRSQEKYCLRESESHTGASAGPGSSDENDDGSVCFICAEKWEITGERRIVALKCGHILCLQCIRKWMAERVRLSLTKSCPVCKEHIPERSIQFLYPTKRTIDVKAQNQVQEKLTEQRCYNSEMQMEVEKLKVDLAIKQQVFEQEKTRTKELFRAHGRRFPSELLQQMHRLNLKCTVEISRERGSRVLLQSEYLCSLVVSQKSDMGPFDGYGIRYVDTPTFVLSNFVRTSKKPVRDMCLCPDQKSVVVASMEYSAYIHDYRNPESYMEYLSFGTPLWACETDRGTREHMLYMGTQDGRIFAYDMRFSEGVVMEYEPDDDKSAVLNIAAVNAGDMFPYGGFLVCTEQELNFFEHTTAGSNHTVTKLNVVGPFSSMKYDPQNETLVVSTRRSACYRWSRYLFGRLKKVKGRTVFHIMATFSGSKNSPIMTRCTQMVVEENTYVAGYLQDEKQMRLFNVERNQLVQSVLVNDVVYDICPVNFNGTSMYLAALTKNKCRIYKMTSKDN